jgi:hypothetical protein
MEKTVPCVFRAKSVRIAPSSSRKKALLGDGARISMTRRNILSITSKAMTVCSIPDSLIRLSLQCPRCHWPDRWPSRKEKPRSAPRRTLFNKLPEKSRCVLFQRMLTIVYVAQDGERLPPPSE